MTAKLRIPPLLVVLLLAGCGTKAAPSAPPDLSAALSEVTGPVRLRQAGSAFTPAADGDMLPIEGQVQTGEGGRARLDLTTGTLVRLAPSSLFTLLSNAPQDDSLITKFRLDLGRVWIILNDGSAEVQTPSGLASVRGSYLMVEVLSDGQTRINCLEGACRLENKYGAVELSTGGSALITGVDAAPKSGVMDESDFRDWLDNNPEAALVVTPGIIPASTATNTPGPSPTPTCTPIPTATETPVPSTTPAQTIVGTWAGTYYVYFPGFGSQPVALRFVFDASGRYSLKFDADVSTGRYAIDYAASPANLDLYNDDGRTALTIIEFTGPDSFRMQNAEPGAPRPGSFTDPMYLTRTGP